MLKRDEISDPQSRWNSTFPDQWVFVLDDRDPCAAEIVRAWIHMRITKGLSKADSPEVMLAAICADQIDEKQGKL